MLLFMPERIYEYFKDDEVLNQKLDIVRKKLMNEEHNYDLKDLLYMNQELFKDVNQYVLKHTPAELKQEIEICVMNHKGEADVYMKNFSDYDVETQIFLLYIYNNGDMKPTEELYQRYLQIVDLYEKSDSTNFSPFIHTIYYFTKLFLTFLTQENMDDMNKNGFISYHLINDYFIFEDKLFNTILNKCKTEQFFHILYHKRIQMMFMFLLFIGQFGENFEKIEENVVRIVYNNRFKYDNFNYLKLCINHIFFQVYFDNGNFSKAKKYLMYNIEIINYGFNHKYEMVKALNHFNKIFTKEFCNYLYCFHKMIHLFIPNLQKYFHIIDNPNATDFEKRLLFGKITDEERQLGIETIPSEWMSFDWCQHNKETFAFFNNIVDNL